MFACYMRTVETLDAAFVDASRTDDAVATVDAFAETTQSEMRERFASLGEAYRTMLRRGMADGSIRSLPIDDVVAALAGNINWVASPDVTGCTLPLPRIATELAALTVFGILP